MFVSQTCKLIRVLKTFSDYFLSGTGLCTNDTLMNKWQVVSTLKQMRIQFHSLPVLLIIR